MSPDIEVGRFALRTFHIKEGRLAPVRRINNTTAGDPAAVEAMDNSWIDGTCTARCLPFGLTIVDDPTDANPLGFSLSLGLMKNHHSAPHPGCECGVYGAFSLQHLRRAYTQAWNRVAVIAAEGQTIIGTRGLRTERARIVAYWTFSNADVMPADAKRYESVYEMVRDYGLSQKASDSATPSSPIEWMR